MTKEERQQRVDTWESVIPAVFKAEDDLSAIWQPRLAEAKFKDEKTRAKVANDYVHALAAHIVEQGCSDD